jgi:hypothetical protein
MYDDDEGGEYEYFETPEDIEEDSRESYVKKMIKESKDLPETFKRPDYKPGPISKELDEKEYESQVPLPEEPKEEPKENQEKKEENKEEYEL